MDLRPLPEMVDGLPNLCGAEAQVEEVTRGHHAVYLPETNLRLDRLQGETRARAAAEATVESTVLTAGELGGAFHGVRTATKSGAGFRWPRFRRRKLARA